MQTNKRTKKTVVLPGTAKLISSVIDNLQSTLLKKQADYGDSAFNRPFLNPNATAEDAILTRLSDKFYRLHNIIKQGSAQVADETVEDTIQDIAGYCVLFLANRKMGSNK